MQEKESVVELIYLWNDQEQKQRRNSERHLMSSRDIPSVVRVETEQANLLLPTPLAPRDDE